MLVFDIQLCEHNFATNLKSVESVWLWKEVCCCAGRGASQDVRVTGLLPRAFEADVRLEITCTFQFAWRALFGVIDR